MQKTVLITGANGFIGSFLVREAINQGYKVFAGVRKNSNLEHLVGLDCEVTIIDFQDEVALEEILLTYHFDYIIQSAGLLRSNKKEELHKVNAAYTLKLLKILRETQAIPSKFVYLSSLTAFGPADRQHTEIVGPNSYPHPISEYGKSKLQAEQFINGFQEIPALVFRPSLVYGPRDRNLFLAMKNIQKGISFQVSKVDQILSFVHVADLARLVVLGLKSSISHKSYFVSDGDIYRLSTFNNLVADILGKKIRNLKIPLWLFRGFVIINERAHYLFGKVPPIGLDNIQELQAESWNCDSSALQRDFDFEPNFKLENGLAETVDWYRDQKWL